MFRKFVEKTLAGYINSVIMLMIVVKYMKVKLTLKRTHLYLDEKLILHNGEAFLKKEDGVMHIEYVEEHDVNVEVKASEDELSILRNGEHRSELVFIPNQKTVGKIISEYGVLPLEIYTRKYIRNHNVIALEYDIIHDDDIVDGFRMIWNMKEDIRA